MKRFLYLASFLIPIIFFFILSYICGYIPFKGASYNAFDAFYEYPTFLMELGNMLKTGRSIFYTLHGALGVNFFCILNLYGGSPLNLLAYFFNNENIYLFYTLLIYLKIGLSGLTMYIYLNSLESKYKDTWWNVIFSFIYALSGYIVAFNMHLMWLDAYILLPLIIKYLDLLINDLKGYKYTIFLALAIIINYYTGFMLCFFMVIYFLYKCLLEKKLDAKRIKAFLFYSILAGLISAIVLVPNIINLLNGRFLKLESNNLFVIDWFTFCSQIYNMSIGSFIIYDNYNFGSTTIYFTLFCLVLIIYYFFNKNISKRNKIITFILLLFFMISFSFRLLDFAWNMFQSPIWWSHRYQFVFVFIGIVIAYNSFINLDIQIKPKFKNLITLLYMVILIASFCYKQLGLKMPDYYALFLIVSVFLFFIYMHKIKAKYYLVILIILEIGLNSYPILMANKGVNYEKERNKYINNKEVIQNILDKDDYRIVDLGGSEDDGLLYSYNSLELFSSSYNMQTAIFMDYVNIQEFGLNHQKMTVYNPCILSLLGVKYIIGESNYFDCNGGICLNDYAMPFMYQVNSDILNVELIESDFQNNINNIYSALLNEKINLFTNINEENITLQNIIFDEEGKLVKYDKDFKIILKYVADKTSLVIPNSSLMTMLNPEIMINGEHYQYEDKGDYLIVLNPSDELVITYSTVSIEDYNLDSYLFSLLDVELYESSIAKLKNSTNYENIIDQNYILKGNITTSDGLVFISIPYDEGLKIKVDGTYVPYVKVLDTFVGVMVNEGNHTITITYIPKGLKLGVIISSISLVILIISILKEKIVLKRCRKKELKYLQ